MNKKPLDATTDGRLQELWTLCQKKDREARKLMIAIVVDDVLARFGRMFIPYRFMGSSKKCGHVSRRQDITITFQHRMLFNCGEKNAEAALELASENVLTALLVSAENVVRHHLKLNKGVPTPAEFSEARRAIWKNNLPTTHVWAGREVAGAFMKKDDWKQYATREKRSDDDVLEGSIGRVLDIAVYSDIFRFDTMQVLDNDEWGIFSDQDKRRVWVDFAPERYVSGNTLLSCTLRIGTEQVQP